MTSGQTHVQAYEKGRSDYTIEYLESVLEQIEGQILLVWDQASWHTSNEVTRWLESCGRIETYLLRSGLRKQTRWKTYGESLKSKWRPVWSGP